MTTHPFTALTHESDTTAFTPQALTEELTELYLRVHAEPLSDDPATDVWRGYTLHLAATLALTVQRLTDLAPHLAEELATWWDAQSEDPDLSDVHVWAEQVVGVDRFREWAANGRKAAAKSAACKTAA